MNLKVVGNTEVKHYECLPLCSTLLILITLQNRISLDDELIHKMLRKAADLPILYKLLNSLKMINLCSRKPFSLPGDKPLKANCHEVI